MTHPYRDPRNAYQQAGDFARSITEEDVDPYHKSFYQYLYMYAPFPRPWWLKQVATWSVVLAAVAVPIALADGHVGPGIVFLVSSATGLVSPILWVLGAVAGFVWASLTGAWIVAIYIVLAMLFSRWVSSLGEQAARNWFRRLPEESQSTVIMWAHGASLTEEQSQAFTAALR